DQEAFYKIYSDFYEQLVRISKDEKNNNLTELAAQIKIEDASSVLRKDLIQNSKKQINKFSEELKLKGMNCAAIKPDQPSDTTPVKPPTESPSKPDAGSDIPSETPSKPVSAIKKAMEKVLAVSYQSCEVLKLKPITAEIPPLEGVKEDCCYPDGIGKLRTIASLKEVQQTHYYLQSPMTGDQCFAVRSHPLIYDYGGRPSYTSGTLGKLNFFKNNGGTNVLGYDCSALVYTVLLGGGFRLKPNKPFVASDVIAAQSRQFINPENNGWSCLKKITMTPTQNLEVGDIASLNGHVVMVYSVGKDPFGIEKLDNCDLVSVNDFDFSIFQSSPSKDGIGINVYEARDYLKTSDKMANIFIDYAKNACLSRKLNKEIQLQRTEYSIIRHQDTGDCMTNPVAFEHESCVVGSCI
ncbi:MAG: hypothetical protein KDD45_04635, partial [Bdellovibrionales bacterium]|nr:hypothetical protein [Bdellovibrionales bacterium]